MNSYIFDTSFLISLIHQDDINHEKAWRILQDIDLNVCRFFISEVILIETYTVLSYKVDFQSTVTLDALLEGIPVQYLSGNLTEYISFFKMLKWVISVADASVISDAFKHDLEILSFDKQLLIIHKEMHFS